MRIRLLEAVTLVDGYHAELEVLGPPQITRAFAERMVEQGKAEWERPLQAAPAVPPAPKPQVEAVPVKPKEEKNGK